jgi:hypothetical protein
MVNRTWQMTENGLKLIDSNNSSVSVLNIPQKKIINIQIREHYPVSKDQLEKLRDQQSYGRLVIDGKNMAYGSIGFDIKKSVDNSFGLEVLKTSTGTSNTEANANTRSIEYAYEQHDSILWLDPIFRFPENNALTYQKVKVILHMPINSRVYISNSLEPCVSDLANTLHKWNGEITNKIWKMTDDGLSEDNEEK